MTKASGPPPGAASAVLGLAGATVLDYPAGRLAQQPLHEPALHVERDAVAADTDVLMVFDEAGVTGHSDHCRATSAATVAADRMGPLLGHREMLRWLRPPAESLAGTSGPGPVVADGGS